MRGVVHREFDFPGQVANSVFYKALVRLHRNMKRKRPRLPIAGNSTTYNAPAHTTFVLTTYLPRIGIATLSQPPYSTDMYPSDIFLLL
ncbi:hypothetical protein NPIL_126751 [Nephila pilipes]|uniref:Uncharacterized protein n=1 Tax=Nephila pilipes TaxID=299642 RepID=A0A8X6UJY9_NEPPI|nr:hypothetical protein NPIL_126751 [Nephila pilipes]